MPHLIHFVPTPFQRNGTKKYKDTVYAPVRLWKLNHEGDPMRKGHWLKRDMWVASNGNLCYFSLKELEASATVHAPLQVL